MRFWGLPSQLDPNFFTWPSHGMNAKAHSRSTRARQPIRIDRINAGEAPRRAADASRHKNDTMMRLLCGLTMAAVAEAGCKPAPRLDGRHAARLAWTRGAPLRGRRREPLREPAPRADGWASFEGEHWLVVKNGRGRRPTARRRSSSLRLRRAPHKLRQEWPSVVARGAWQLHNYACWPRMLSGASRARRPRSTPRR